MTNDDHFTGEIKGLKAGVLYVSMKYILGTSSVQWSEVARLESKQLFLVKTQDGSVYTGTLNTANIPSGRPMEIEVAETPGQEVKIDRSRIVEMDVTSAKFVQRFNGSVNTGIIYSKGNQSTQYNIGAQVSYPRERWAAGASFNSTLSASTGASASTRNQVDVLCPPPHALEQLVLRGRRDLPPKLRAWDNRPPNTLSGSDYGSSSGLTWAFGNK